MPPIPPPRAARVLAVVSNKGGVGKTTVSTNLAIYLRALCEDLPVLLVGLDDQDVVDRMFSLRPPAPGDGNLKHGWAERSLSRVTQLGEYGVHFVPSPPDTALLKARAADMRILKGILERTRWNGVIILDTKSELEALTLNAIYAADRIVLPVSDRTSLLEAGKVFGILDRFGLPRDRARILLTLVDLRTRIDAAGRDLLALLIQEIRTRGWPLYESFLSRSPRVEALISGGPRPLSILEHAPGTAIQRQLRAFAEEVLVELEEVGLATPTGAGEPPTVETRESAATSADWKNVLLRGRRRS